jgi:hypothetical protein
MAHGMTRRELADHWCHRPHPLSAEEWSPVTAYQKNLKGLIIAPALFMWNVEKT